MRAIALWIGAIFLPIATLAPAAAIDESYQYDALNRLTTAGATTYQHDAAGNLVQIVSPAPEIAVEQPAGTSIPDGGSKDFGTVTLGASSMTSTFTVRNTGSGDLTGLAIIIDGSNASDFTVTASPAGSITGPSGTTTFGIRFLPSAIGARTAVLHLANNDPDESPFDIILTGAALSPYNAWINGFSSIPGAERTFTADPDHDGIPNAVEMVLGGNPATVMDSTLLPSALLVTNPGGTLPAGNYLLFTYRRTEASRSAGVVAAVEYDGDLTGTWTDAINGVGGIQILEDNDFFATGIDRVRAYIPRAANSKAFVRLKVIEDLEAIDENPPLPSGP